ncbi:hypothetical protein FRB90_005925, partial [Tulasnella sp. 427]
MTDLYMAAERRDAEEFWTLLDSNADGKVTLEEWLVGHRKRYVASDEDARKFFEEWDLNGDGVIDPKEFWKCVAMCKVGTSPGVVKQFWSSVDVDGKGFVVVEDVIRYFSSLFGEVDSNGKERLSKLFEESDTDHDGKLNFDEERQKVEQEWKDLDRKNRGTIDFGDYREVLEERGVPKRAAWVSFDELDLDGDHRVSGIEFMRAAALKKRGITAVTMRELWRHMEPDWDNVVNRETVIRSFSALFAGNCTRAEIRQWMHTLEELFDEFDQDQDELLNFDEFYGIVERFFPNFWGPPLSKKPVEEPVEFNWDQIAAL